MGGPLGESAWRVDGAESDGCLAPVSENLGEKNMPERLFCLLSAAAVLYFYLIRKMDEFRYAYGIYLALPLLLMQSAAEPVDKIKKKKCGNGGLR